MNGQVTSVAMDRNGDWDVKLGAEDQNPVQDEFDAIARAYGGEVIDVVCKMSEDVARETNIGRLDIGSEAIVQGVVTQEGNTDLVLRPCRVKGE